jgi:hypothetical protein
LASLGTASHSAVNSSVGSKSTQGGYLDAFAPSSLKRTETQPRQADLRCWRSIRRRSRSVRPPHTPSRSWAASEYSRHAWRAEHDAQTAFASSESTSDTGKKTSGSTPRHAALWRQLAFIPVRFLRLSVVDGDLPRQDRFAGDRSAAAALLSHARGFAGRSLDYE